MGYQALLFCPDEKLARIVAQVFTDLEFNVDSVQEPFSAVKKLMAQRFDALVVDCENESNAALLFKSARNSSSNQGCLAIAVVEGQAGVAKAYRIGANLVLTKPINVEQAKGTLRVARGLLRKHSEAATTAGSVPSTPAPAAPPAAASPVPRTVPATAPTVPVSTATTSASSATSREVPEFEPIQPTIAASANEALTLQQASAAQAPALASAAPETVAPAAPKEPIEASTAAAPAGSSAKPSFTSAQGAATAPAKVKQDIPAETKPAKMPVEFDHEDPVYANVAMTEREAVGSTPSFSALELDQSGKPGGNKKVVIAAVAVVAVALVGYFGWTSFSGHKPANPVVAPASTVPTSSPASAPNQTKPSPSTTPTPSETTVPAAVSSAPVKAEKPAAIPHIEVSSEPENSAPTPAPLVVKSKPNKQAKAAEDAGAAVPNPLAVSDGSTSTLDNLVASSGATPTQPSLATLKISQGVSQGLLIKRVEPKYPQAALAMRIQGAVVLDATISKEGNISNLTVNKGDKTLARAASDAVKQWRYKPYYLDGQPVEIQTQITVNFKLPN